MNTAAAILILLITLVLWGNALREQGMADRTPAGLNVTPGTSVTNTKAPDNVQSFSGHEPTNNAEPSQ